ncbi:hypothetical protein [uncultured Kocuria sp.]|uniref:hypothetical protein n=1 Tax=uncultured Kocuria sp. TaxID=259305 RepID=UPI00260F06BA|nr:hypothetical protein [uncultured Kocuria sp.]
MSTQPVLAWLDEGGGHGRPPGFTSVAPPKVAAMLGIPQQLADLEDAERAEAGRGDL